MIEKQLIKLLLNKDFYEKNKGKVSKGMFTNGTGNLYETITKAHNKRDVITLYSFALVVLALYIWRKDTILLVTALVLIGLGLLRKYWLGKMLKK